jgi:hypothetical protein
VKEVKVAWCRASTNQLRLQMFASPTTSIFIEFGL